MKSLSVILTAALLCAVVFSINSAYAGSDAEIVAMVEKAAAMFKEKGKDYTLKVIGSLEGPFRKQEMYVFAVAFDGTTLAHPVNKGLEGKNVLDMKDAKGKLFMQEFIKVAKDPGSGWVEYSWLRHGEKDPTPKRSYILKVPGENIFVGGGVYDKKQ
jgi:signal transduction histidine kinase